MMRFLLPCLAVTVWMAGCSTHLKPITQQEEFDSTGKYSRMFDASPADT